MNLGAGRRALFNPVYAGIFLTLFLLRSTVLESPGDDSAESNKLLFVLDSKLPQTDPRSHMNKKSNSSLWKSQESICWAPCFL
jgi:hypothetical protein